MMAHSLVNIGLDNGLKPIWSQAINESVLMHFLIGPFNGNKCQCLVNQNTIGLQETVLLNVDCKMFAILCRPQFVNVETNARVIYIGGQRFAALCQDIILN